MGLYARLHPRKSCTKRVGFLHFTPFFGSLPPLTRYAWARVLSLQFPENVPPLCPSTCPPTSHFPTFISHLSHSSHHSHKSHLNAMPTTFQHRRNAAPQTPETPADKGFTHPQTKKATRVNVQPSLRQSYVVST